MTLLIVMEVELLLTALCTALSQVVAKGHEINPGGRETRDGEFFPASASRKASGKMLSLRGSIKSLIVRKRRE